MVNRWVEHIRKFAKENNKTYGCALSDPACRASYKSGKAPTQKSERASMGGNDVNRARSVRSELRNMAKRRDALEDLKSAGRNAKARMEDMGAVRTFKNKKSNKNASKLGAIHKIGKSAMTVLPYQG
jgi:hypothetical protein